MTCVAAGGLCTAVCTDAGEVYTFSDGGLGGLRHGSWDTVWEPRLVQSLVGTKVVGVAVGFGHVAVCTEAGGVLSCGDGVHGALGHDSENNESTPRVVEALVGMAVVGIAAGKHHTAAWTAQGQFFTWGNALCVGHGGAQEEPPCHDLDANHTATIRPTLGQP